MRATAGGAFVNSSSPCGTIGFKSPHVAEDTARVVVLVLGSACAKHGPSGGSGCRKGSVHLALPSQTVVVGSWFISRSHLQSTVSEVLRGYHNHIEEGGGDQAAENDDRHERP
jgi:hypothetical protein